MTTDGKSFCASDETDRLAKRLLGRRHILLWGDMGCGKSSLALQLLPQLDRQAGHCRLLELDPGSAPFGIPGTVCRAWLTPRGFGWGDCQALCTLDSARFRLPLVLAAGSLLAIEAGEDERGPLLIDPPGVVRGVGGAELLTALAARCGVDAVVAIRRGEGGLPLAVELASLGADLIPVAAAPAARLPARLERLKNRTRLWNHWLQTSLEQVLDLDRLLVLGTPPPREVPAAWAGRQAALLSGAGETLAVGEILHLDHSRITARIRWCRAGDPAILLVRDSGRDGAGRLATIAPVNRTQTAPRIPPEMGPPILPPAAGTAPVASHLGPAWASLVGGVFGDPLLHVRLCQRKISLLFDLGDSARLLARIAHQVQCVFLSHAHLDHIGGFLWFLRSRIGLFPPFRVFGPVETIDRLESFLGAVTWDRIKGKGPVFEVAEIDGASLRRARLQPGQPKQLLPVLPIRNGAIVAEEDYTIRCVILDHHTPSIAYSCEFGQEIKVRRERLAAAGLAPGPWLGRLKQCVAAASPEAQIELPGGRRAKAGELIRELLIVRPGTKLAYVTDLADTPENRRKVIELARSAHTLFCEAAFMAADRDKALASQHLTTLAAIRIARDAGVERLAPFHFSKRYERAPAAIYEELLAEAGPLRILGHSGY